MSAQLDQIIYQFNGQEPFTIRDACEGIQIFGGIGSGKTSGSGESIAKAFLKAGFGGLVLCAKKDVLDDWQRYAKETGRSNNLLVFDASGRYVFPFLQYEINRQGEGAGYTENLVRLFTTVYESIDGSSRGDHSDPYWVRAMQQLLRNTIDLCLIARRTLSVPMINEVIQSAPANVGQLEDKDWQDTSLCWQLLVEAKTIKVNKWQEYDLQSTARFWMMDYPSLGERTRSSIQSMLSSMLDILGRSPFRMLFSENPDDPMKIAYPELTHKGAVIIINLPVKEYGDAGRAAQIIYKYLWQQAVERRKVGKDTIPVFLWVDEAQHFVGEYDMLFQATARSTMACTVYMTQNLPNYYAQMGGEQSRYRVDSLVGNLQTKIWHANSDTTTNEHAANVIGKNWLVQKNTSDSFGVNHFNISTDQQKHFEYELPPQFFTKLKKGGTLNQNIVEAVVFQNGRLWKNQKTFLFAQFKQHEHG